MIKDLVLPSFRLFSGEPEINCLHDIMICVLLETIRPKRIYISAMNMAFPFVQIAIIDVIVMVVPEIMQAHLLWVCAGTMGTYILILFWAGIMFIAGCIGTFAKSSLFFHDEILHLSPWTPNTSSKRCDDCSLSATLPPTRVHGPVTRCISNLKSHLEIYWFSIWARPKAQQYISGVIPLLKSFVIVQNTRRAMVVILRPSTDSDGAPVEIATILFGLLRGFTQALLLIALTAVFGSTFHNGIIESIGFIMFFLAGILASRVHSIYYCMRMERLLQTTIIEYRTPTELTAIKAILAGMPSVVVDNITDGSTYYEGYRLDRNPNCATHPPTTVKTDPRTFARHVSLVTLVGFHLPLGLLTYCILFTTVPLPRISDVAGACRWIFLTLLLVLAGFGFVSKINADFDFIDIHQNGVLTTVEPPTAQV